MAKRNWKVTFVWFAACCVLLVAAFFVGINDNPPGLFLCYLATAALILAFVHTWRKVRKFLILLGASVIGFFVFVVLHNAFYALSKMTADIIVLRLLLEFFHVAFFLTAIFVCPAGFLVGTVGSIITVIMYFKKKQAQDKFA